MKWKNELSAENIRIWKERLVILVLLGVLVLVILLPVKENNDTGGMLWEGEKRAQTESAGESGEAAFQDEGSQGSGAGTDSAGTGETEAYVRQLERRLAQTLSYMEGVGAVKVMITLEDEGEAVVEKDVPNSRSILSEQDSAGGSRSTNEYESSETTIYRTEQNGTQIPYVVSRKRPQIAGIVVVAQGGGDSETVRDITGAIQALFGIEPHKIKVVKMISLEK